MNTVWIVLPVLIALMFQLGIELDRQAFAGVARRPAAVVAGLLGQLALLPLIAFGVGLAAGALILLAMAGGSLLARLFRLRRAVRRTIVIEVGMQNAAQAIAVATSPLIFDSGEMAVPAIVYALVMNVVLLSYLKLLPKCTDETASEGA